MCPTRGPPGARPGWQLWREAVESWILTAARQLAGAPLGETLGSNERPGPWKGRGPGGRDQKRPRQRTGPWPWHTGPSLSARGARGTCQPNPPHGKRAPAGQPEAPLALSADDEGAEAWLRAALGPAAAGPGHGRLWPAVLHLGASQRDSRRRSPHKEQPEEPVGQVRGRVRPVGDLSVPEPTLGVGAREWP